MFSYLTGKKKPNQFILEEKFIIVEFLTEDQKVQKDMKVKKLQADFANDFETMISYETSFQYSYRLTLDTKTVKSKITLAEIMALLQVSSDADFNEFYQTQVNKVKLHMTGGHLVNDQDVLRLYNQRDISLYNPDEVLEVIYVKKGLFDRIKLKAKKAIVRLPQTMLGLLAKFLAAILKYMGFSTGKSIVFKFLPFKAIMQWILNFLMVFFPALAPFMAISKMLI